MIIIGVTGNIGSGKSTVCQILAQLGATIIDADKLAHETYKPHSKTWQELITAFGKNIVKANQEIDRQKLGQMVFSDPDALAKLNQIVHPGVYHLAQERIETYRCQKLKAIIVEATLLLEAGWTDLVDKVWLIIAPQDVAIQRLIHHKGIPETQILNRLKSQMPTQEKMRCADEIIYNDGTIPQLEAKVTRFWHKLNIA